MYYVPNNAMLPETVIFLFDALSVLGCMLLKTALKNSVLALLNAAIARKTILPILENAPLVLPTSSGSSRKNEPQIHSTNQQLQRRNVCLHEAPYLRHLAYQVANLELWLR